MKKYIPSTELTRCSVELARRVLDSGWKPDAIIGLSRGGLFPSVVIDDWLRAHGVDAEHWVLKCRAYDPSRAESLPGRAEVSCVSPEMAKAAEGWEGKKVLVVDDICDTGETFSAVESKLAKLFEDANLEEKPEIRRAVIAWKPGKHAPLKPHWWAKEYENDDWVVFPHEFAGLSKEEI